MTFKIGFHTGPSGNRTGIGAHWRALDDADIPAVLAMVDDHNGTGLVEMARTTGVPHVVRFRLTTAGQRDGYDYDVPPYHLLPERAAAIHWQATVAKLPPEFDRDIEWLEVINEVDKNRAGWLGYFGLELAKLANADGYRVALFGFSPGEPEPDAWKTSGMKAYLRYCAENHDRAAVALHEYSLNASGMQEAYPHLIGRFETLFKACDELNIRRPLVLISEFGWTRDDIPTPAHAMEDIKWAADLYAEYPEVIGATIWYLGGGFGDIANKAQKLIAPVTQMALSYEPPPVVKPPPNPEPDEWRMTLENTSTGERQVFIGKLENG